MTLLVNDTATATRATTSNAVHLTKNKISYMSCFPKPSISYAFLVEDRD